MDGYIEILKIILKNSEEFEDIIKNISIKILTHIF